MNTKRTLGTVALCAPLLLSAVLPAAAHDATSASGSRPATAPSRPVGPTDRAELEAFSDGLLHKEMADYHIAGAAVAVVKDGKLFFSKGYGDADVAKSSPVDPERTIFRIGSLTKLFTWTAVMQLVEQGRLDLGADVNTYLDFRIPATYPQPITLKQLMTHTSGFEDVLLGSLAPDAAGLIPARDWLIAHMAARVCPPGECAGYSNYNAMLAGYIVARVAGQPYDEYVQEHILSPLDMAHSSARSVIPAELRPQASLGYTYANGLQPFPDYAVQPAHLPSGGVEASANDMARFMIAHLEGGTYSDATIADGRILAASTARQMQTTLYTPDPRLLGTAYGFFDWTDNGQRTLGHSGYEPPMNSVLMLLPDQHLGVFVVYNSQAAGALTKQHAGFQRAFFDHYYPAPAVAPIRPLADFASRADRFVGTYRYASRPASSLIKVFGLMGGYSTAVSNPGDGTLRLDISGLEFRFAEVAPLFFRQVDGPYHLIFREDAGGHITTLYTDLMPEYTSVKLEWYETPGFDLALLLACVLLFLSLVFVALVRAIRSRRRHGVGTPSRRGARLAGRILLGIGVLNLLFLVGAALWGMPTSELHSPSVMAGIVLALGVLSAGLTSVALICAVLAWKGAYWSIRFRAYYTLGTAAAVSFVWMLSYWNLLGWRY